MCVAHSPINPPSFKNLRANICDSVSNPLTKAFQERQGPSIVLLSQVQRAA